MEPDNQDELNPEQKKSASRGAGPGLLIPLVLIAILAGIWFVQSSGPKRTEIPYSFFIDQLRANNILEVDLYSKYGLGRFVKPPLLPAAPPPPADTKAKKTSADSKAERKIADGSAETNEPKQAEPYFVVKLPAGAKDNPLLNK